LEELKKEQRKKKKNKAKAVCPFYFSKRATINISSGARGGGRPLGRRAQKGFLRGEKLE